MSHDDPTETPDTRVIYGWPLSKLYKKPEHVPDVLKRFGPQPLSTLREIVGALDEMALNWGVAHRRKRPPKFADADPKLERFENLLIKGKKLWDDLRPLHSTFVTLMALGIPPNERKEKVDPARATINFDLVATKLLPIIQQLRDPKAYNAAHRLPHQRSAERAFLWEPLLQLMEKHHVKPGQHGSIPGAIKSLHLALGINPQEGAVKKMLHDLKRDKPPKRRDGYATAKKRPDA